MGLADDYFAPGEAAVLAAFTGWFNMDLDGIKHGADYGSKSTRQCERRYFMGTLQ